MFIYLVEVNPLETTLSHHPTNAFLMEQEHTHPPTLHFLPFILVKEIKFKPLDQSDLQDPLSQRCRDGHPTLVYMACSLFKFFVPNITCFDYMLYMY